MTTASQGGPTTPGPGADSGQAKWTPSAAASSTTPAGEAQLPLQQYMLMGRDRQTVLRAHSVLVQDCMRDQGFTTRLPAPVAETGVAVDLSTRRYGIDSLAAAQEHGYQDAYQTAELSQAQQEAQAFTAALSPAERKALGGEPVAETQRFRDGCLGQADKALSRDTSTVGFAGLGVPSLVRTVNVGPRATDSPATRRALKSFASCMTQAGYPEVVDPREAPNRFLADENLTQQEKTAAVAQFSCQQSSGVTAAMRQAETAFQLAAVERNPEAFAQVKSELASIVRRATEVLGGQPS